MYPSLNAVTSSNLTVSNSVFNTSVLNNNDLNILGCDIKDMLGKMDMQDAPAR